MTRRYWTEAKTRANELAKDDVILVNGAWRQVLDVCHTYDAAKTCASAALKHPASAWNPLSISILPVAPTLALYEDAWTPPLGIAGAALASATEGDYVVARLHEVTSGTTDEVWLVAPAVHLLTIQVPAV